MKPTSRAFTVLRKGIQSTASYDVQQDKHGRPLIIFAFRRDDEPDGPWADVLYLDPDIPEDDPHPTLKWDDKKRLAGDDLEGLKL